MLSRWSWHAALVSLAVLPCLGQTAIVPTPRQMRDRSNEVSDLTSLVPYQIHAVVISNSGRRDQQKGELTIYRDKNRSRFDLRLGNYREVRIVANKSLYISRSQPYPISGIEQLENLEMSCRGRL